MAALRWYAVSYLQEVVHEFESKDRVTAEREARDYARNNNLKLLSVEPARVIAPPAVTP